MRINTNIAAMNTQRQLNVNNINSGKSIEKLSSGQRINRAADDAAGLQISEKMRAQVRGLNRASQNAQDGISLIQSAESALSEYTNILQRVRELSVQGSNEAINTPDEYAAIGAEVDALNNELNRIIEVTQFNGKNMFDGTVTDANFFHVGSNAGGDNAANQINLPDMTIDPPSYTIGDAREADAMIQQMDQD